MKTILVLLAACLLVGCVDERSARRVLEDQGFTDIQITGHRAFICGDTYTYATGFAAQSIAKRPVTGAVCSDYFKGNLIKLD